MAKSKLFGTNIDPACSYCLLGRPAPDRVMVLCRKYGPVAPFYSCKKFRYDPLKRIPKKQPELPQYSPDDFQL